MTDISIIIPVYNTEKYLDRCVGSILQQENVSFELILVDDGSTDNSSSICDSYNKKYSFITSIHINNSGPATAKNEGLVIAKGNYVAFFDSDDAIKPTMLYEMLTVASEYNADIVCCNYEQIDEKGKISHTSHTGKIIPMDRKAGIKHLLSKDKIYSQCWTKIYRTALLREQNIANLNGLKTEEDFIFNIHAFCYANQSAIIDKPLYIYTHRSDSLAHNYFRDNIDIFINNRILRVNTTDNILEKLCPDMNEWGYAHNILYYNELLGKVSLFPTLYSDSRIKEAIAYIRNHKKVLYNNLSFCGFSKIGALLILYLPIRLYLLYRKYKAKK